jgi:hypothetical protein
MLTLFTGLILALAGQEAQVDPTQEFTNLCKAMAECESYKFQIVTKQEGGMMRMGGRGGAPEPTTVSGQFKKGQPYHIKSSDTEAYRLLDQIVFRGAEGKWQRFDREAMMAGRRGQRGDRAQRGEGGDRGERGQRGEGADRGERGQRGEGGDRGERGQRGDRAGGDFSSMRTVFTMSRVTLPHEIIKQFEGKVKDIQCEKKDGKVIYKGVLTKEGAEALGGGARFGRMRGQGGEGGQSFKNSGTIELIASEKGVIEKIAVDTKMSGSFGDRSFERSQKISVAVSDLGKVKFEVPEEVMSEFVL